MTETPPFDTDNPVLVKILEDFTKISAREMQKAVAIRGLVLTGELLASIREGDIQKGQGFITASIYYSELLRIKDRKTLRYTTVPPYKAMQDFVEKIGIDKFPFVEGFKNGRRSASESVNIRRVAKAIQFNHEKRVAIKRGGIGIYNDVLKTKILPNFYRELREFAVKTAAENLTTITNGN